MVTIVCLHRVSLCKTKNYVYNFYTIYMPYIQTDSLESESVLLIV